MAEQSKTIQVMARPDLAGRTALWERHPDHPGGEVFVAGDEVVEVAETAEVVARLHPDPRNGGTLVRLEGKALDRALEAQALRREQAGQARLAALGVTPLPAVVERQSATPEDVAAAHERVSALEAQIADLNAKIAALTAPATPEGAGAEQPVAGARGAKPAKGEE